MLLLGIVEIPLWVILGCLAITIFLVYNTWHFNFFRKQGIPGDRPWPIIGNISFRGDRVKEYPYMETEIQEKHGDIFAEFIGRIPCLVVHDESFLSEVLVKSFPDFCDRSSVLNGDEVSDAMLLNSMGERWKRMRSYMTPTFSTGKLKQMIPEINRCARQLANNLAKEAEKGETLDMRGLTGAFSMDVIASTAFGMRVDSQNDADSVFVQKAKRGFSRSMFNPLYLLAFFLPAAVPLATKLGLNSFLPRDVMDFFRDVTLKAMEARKTNQDQSRTDFLQLVMNVERDENVQAVPDTGHDKDVTKPTKGLSTTEILANAILFFIAGYDTTASAVCMLLYNLALNDDCQQRLLQEIDSVVGENDLITYDKLSEMPYLDQCISESLRLFPPLVRANREAKRDVTINGVHIKKGMIVMIPIFGIHHDPKKWPNPLQFDPTRFLPENKAGRNPFHFFPFGMGPRNCIGMRLALAELKIAMVHVLRKVKVTPATDTPSRVKFTVAPLLTPASPIMLNVEARKKSN